MFKFLCVFAALACASGAVHAAPTSDEVSQCDHHLFPVRLILRRYSTQEIQLKYCSGVRISMQWVLTAAECFDNPDHEHIQVSLPDHSILNGKCYQTERNERQTRDSLEIKIHPQYNITSKANNLALLRVKFLPAFNEETPIALPYLKDGKTSYEDQFGTVHTFDGGPFDNLRYVTVRDAMVVTKHFCSAEPLYVVDTEKYICARVYGGRIVSEEDVGAPLVYQTTENKTKKLIGILTSEKNLTELHANVSVRFTRVYGHLDWINSATGIKLRKDFEDE